MIAPNDPHFMSPQDYLVWEAEQPINYQYLNGEAYTIPYAMMGGTLFRLNERGKWDLTPYAIDAVVTGMDSYVHSEAATTPDDWMIQWTRVDYVGALVYLCGARIALLYEDVELS